MRFLTVGHTYQLGVGSTVKYTQYLFFMRWLYLEYTGLRMSYAPGPQEARGNVEGQAIRGREELREGEDESPHLLIIHTMRDTRCRGEGRGEVWSERARRRTPIDKNSRFAGPIGAVRERRSVQEGRARCQILSRGSITSTGF